MKSDVEEPFNQRLFQLVMFCSADGRAQQLSNVLSKCNPALRCRLLMALEEGSSKTPLIVAAENGNCDTIILIIVCLQRLLKHKPLDQDSYQRYLKMWDQSGLTALHWSCFRGYKEAMLIILHLEPNLVSCTDRNGNSVLHLAISLRNIDMISTLQKSSESASYTNIMGMCNVGIRNKEKRCFSGTAATGSVRIERHSDPNAISSAVFSGLVSGKGVLSTVYNRVPFYTYTISMLIAFIFMLAMIVYDGRTICPAIEISNPVNDAGLKPTSVSFATDINSPGDSYKTGSTPLHNYIAPSVGLNMLSCIFQLLAWYCTWKVYIMDPGVLPVGPSPFPEESNPKGAQQSAICTAYQREAQKQCLNPFDSSVASHPRSYVKALNMFADHSLGLKGVPLSATPNSTTTTTAQANVDNEEVKQFSLHASCCHVCSLWRPLRAGHGRLRGRCIIQYDHFCFYLWSDVGLWNYPYFFFYLFNLALLTIPCFIWLSARFLVVRGMLLVLLPNNHHHQLIHVESQEGQDGQEAFNEGLQGFNPERIVSDCETFQWLFAASLRAFLIWCVLVWIMVFLLFIYHCYITCLGLTTREQVISSKMYSVSRGNCCSSDGGSNSSGDGCRGDVNDDGSGGVGSVGYMCRLSNYPDSFYRKPSVFNVLDKLFPSFVRSIDNCQHYKSRSNGNYRQSNSSQSKSSCDGPWWICYTEQELLDFMHFSKNRWQRCIGVDLAAVCLHTMRCGFSIKRTLWRGCDTFFPIHTRVRSFLNSCCGFSWCWTWSCPPCICDTDVVVKSKSFVSVERAEAGSLVPAETSLISPYTTTVSNYAVVDKQC